ncbi:MAG: flagellar filament capping protein FliD [Planctomycetes bacterium]|nr:flagellar filament capping protein FliD [Planctomycetota bacterium]
MSDTLISSLSGGQGLGTLDEIAITDRAGGNDTVDLSSAETLSDVVELINASSAAVSASINTARNGITLTDTSGGSGNFIVANNGANNTADALGIAVNATQASIDSGTLGRQTLSEATRLASLNGGTGITASDITITDSNGQTVSIDLNPSGSEAKTIGDVIDAINATTIGVTASINGTGDGILLTDTALGSQTLGVTDLNGTLAADLNLTRASTTIDINGTDTQVVDGTGAYSVDLSDIDGSSNSISLSTLNGGAGIDASDIRITDSSGSGITVLDLNGADAGITTIGQLIDAINDRAAAGANVTASINSSGTGILLTDNVVNGTENLLVEDVNGTAAADLKILSTDTTTTTIDGIGLFSAQSGSQGALELVASRINDLEAGVTASTFFDGVGYRLSLVVDQTGSANEILLDAGASGFVFEETSRAQDALLVIGEQTAGSGVLVSSTTNNFEEIIGGVDLTVVASSDTPIDIIVASTDADFVDAVEGFVDAYNAIRSALDDFTDFNEDDLSTGLLFGTNEALRVDTQLSRLVTDRYFGVGGIESLQEIGLNVDDQGKLQLDVAELKEAFADNPNGLRTFFADDTNGLVAKFDQAIERLAGADNGLLTNRNDSLQATIDINQQRIDRFNESLDRQRERLLLQFFQLEQVIAGLQQSQTALNTLSPLAPLVSA